MRVPSPLVPEIRLPVVTVPPTAPFDHVLKKLLSLLAGKISAMRDLLARGTF